MKKQLLALCILLIAGAHVKAQTLLNENFNYKPGALTNFLSGANVSGGNWVTLGGTGVPLTVPSTGLSYLGYGSSGIGNSLSLVDTTAAAEDAYRQFATQTTGTVYCALLLKVTDTVGLAAYPSTTTPDFFTGFLSSLSTNTVLARLYIRKGSTGNTFQLGIKGNNSNSISFVQKDIDVDSTTLIVFAYSIVTGTNNDSARLWINPGVVTQPAADVKSAITGGGDATDIARVVIRQGVSGTPNARMDGIHVGLSWTAIMGASTGPITPVNTVTSSATGLSTASFSWNRPGDYDPATMQTIAFLKKTAPVTIGTPTFNPSHYAANTNFATGGTPYQNDSLAKCVFNGDSNTVDISGLSITTGYTLAVFIVRTPDSTYSAVSTATVTTQSNRPPTVTAALFSLTSFNNTTLSWSKPAGYVDSNMTILVFLKQSTQVFASGTVNANPTVYLANPDFAANGTKFLNDTLAKCIYNGDGTTIPISGLLTGTSYYATFYVVRSTDSNYYSSSTTAAVTTTTQPASVSSLSFNATGQNSATVTWTKPIGYNNATMTTLVFVKQTSGINTVLHPSKNTNGYIENPDFAGKGGTFQYDSLAKCVMNSDSSFVNITGLLLNTTYHVTVYVVRTADSVYSIETNSFGITFGSVFPPKPLTAFSFKANGASAALASWTKDSSFMDTSNIVLVFVKSGSSIIQGIPNSNPNTYIANTSLGKGTPYQNDTAAKCVYKGNGTNVSITDLQASTSYYVAASVVRPSDSSYASAATSSITTAANPVSAVSLVGQSGSSAKITWTKPASYVNGTYTTLVFVKADSAVTVGTPTRIPAVYTANTNLGSGSRYQNDAAAFCVFRADTNFVVITNLLQQKNYEVLILVVRDSDSAYSLGANGSGKTLPPPNPVSIGSVNTTNPVTGNPDSLNVRVTLRGISYGTNQVTGGLKFVLRDATSGITVLSTSKTFGYTVTEGDSLEVQGSITSLRGLTCVTIDTLFKREIGKSVKSPMPVSKLGETTENDLVRVNKLRFLSPPAANWFNSTYTCVIDGTSDTINIRITAGSGLNGTATPVTATFSVIGLAGQVSTSTAAPFLFNGYQIVPRTGRDIILPDTLAAFTLLSPSMDDTLNFTDTGDVVSFNWTKARSFVTTQATYTLLMDTVNGNFSSPALEIPSGNSGIDSVYRTTALALSTAIKLQPGQVAKVSWKVRAVLGSYSEYSNTNTLFITRPMFSGIQSVRTPQSFTLHPNPASRMLVIKHSETIQSVIVINQLGQTVWQQSADASEILLATENLDRGVYFVGIKTATGFITKKLILN